MMMLADKLAALRAMTMPRRFAAVDFDSRELRVVLAERVGASQRIVRLAHAQLPDDIDPADAPALGRFLAAALKEMSIRVKAVVMNVPRCRAVLTPLQLPAGTSAEDLPGMVQYQVDKELPFRIAEAVVDFAIARHFAADAAADSELPHLDVLAATVRLPVVEHYKQIALSAGVKLLRLGLRPNANLRCVTACLGQEQEVPAPLAIVNVTADETEIDVTDGKSLAFSRSTLIAVPPTDSSTQASADQASRALASEIVRSLQTYQVAERGDPIRRILVAGGTGIEARLAKAMSRLLGVQCERFNPAQALSLADDGSASAFISALGLAIAGARTAEVDFLNPKRPRVRRKVRKASRSIIPAAVAAVALIVAIVLGVRVHGKKSRVADMRSELSRLREANKKVTAVAKPLKAIEKWIERDRPWADHWAYLSSVLPPCGDLYVTDIRSPREGHLKIAVQARQAHVLEDMKGNLRRAGYKFTTDGVATKDNRLGYNYTTSVDIAIDPDKRLDLAGAAKPERPTDDMSGEMNGNFDRARGTRRGGARRGRRR